MERHWNFGCEYLGATWSDSQNTYTVSFNNSGSGGHITVTGTLNINADLPASTVIDVQLEVNMALGLAPCTNPDGVCDVIGVQRVVNVALGGSCVAP
jgi:hypothetical protein